MDADVSIDVADHGRHCFLHIRGQGAAVGVTENDCFCASHRGSFHNTKRKFGVALVAVEKVLGIKKHSLALRHQVLDRVGNHGHALFERGLERLGDVVVPAFSDDANHARFGTNEVGESLV